MICKFYDWSLNFHQKSSSVCL